MTTATTGRSGTGGNEEASFDHGSDGDQNDTAAINKSVRIGMKKNFGGTPKDDKDGDELSFGSDEADPLLNKSCAAPHSSKALTSSKK